MADRAQQALRITEASSISMAKRASATDMFPSSGDDEPLLHGGDLAAARRLFPGAPEPFIDLSTGINPDPYPVPRFSAACSARLPDAVRWHALAAAAAQAYGAPSAAHVVPAPGTQILLPLVAGLVRRRAAPPFWRRAMPNMPAPRRLPGTASTQVRGLARLRRRRRSSSSPIPTIRTAGYSPAAICSRSPKSCAGAAACSWSTKRSWMWGRADASLAPEVARGNIVVLRSFGKFFGLAGLRLGFALAAPPLAARLGAALGPWAVSGPALAVGTQALADTAWIERTRRRLDKASARLDEMLADWR